MNTVKTKNDLESGFATYIYKTPKERMSIMLANYRGFELKWTKLFNELAYMINEQKECNRRSTGGDLGVRVQSSHAASSPTENKAISLMEIEAEIEMCDFNHGLLSNLDDPEEIRDKVLALYIMKTEFEALAMEIDYLEEEDRLFLLKRIYEGKSWSVIADEEGMEVQSVEKKLGRIRKSLLEALQANTQCELDVLEEIRKR